MEADPGLVGQPGDPLGAEHFSRRLLPLRLDHSRRLPVIAIRVVRLGLWFVTVMLPSGARLGSGPGWCRQGEWLGS